MNAAVRHGSILPHSLRRPLFCPTSRPATDPASQSPGRSSTKWPFRFCNTHRSSEIHLHPVPRLRDEPRLYRTLSTVLELRDELLYVFSRVVGQISLSYCRPRGGINESNDPDNKQAGTPLAIIGARVFKCDERKNYMEGTNRFVWIIVRRVFGGSRAR